MTQAPKQAYEAWRITHQSSELAARSAFDTAEMLQQELLTARATISNLERDELTAITQRDDASYFIDKILDEVLGQDRHEWTSAYDRDDALADVEAKMAALKSSKCLHQIAEPAAQGMDAQDAARWREVLQHVGAAPHFGGQHFTLNTLLAPDTSLGFKANLMSGSVAQHFTKAIDATLAAQAKQGGV